MPKENIHVLVVDDDDEINQLIAKTLEQYGFTITTAGNGTEMFAAIDKQKPDIIILDLMLPGESGLTLCQKLQGKIPVIMLTAMSEETDRIVGLEVGADDYLAKPFNPRELIARIKAIIRRLHFIPEESPIPSAITNEYLLFSQWKLNRLSRSLFSQEDEMEISLSASEYDLLIAFAENPQRVLSRDELIELTKNRTLTPEDRSIDVQISRLRHKIEEDPKKPKLIKTVRGGGYLFTSTVEAK